MVWKYLGDVLVDQDTQQLLWTLSLATPPPVTDASMAGEDGWIPALCCLLLQRFWGQGLECESHGII